MLYYCIYQKVQLKTVSNKKKMSDIEIIVTAELHCSALVVSYECKKQDLNSLSEL